MSEIAIPRQEFAFAIAEMSLSVADLAVAILWFEDHFSPGIAMSAGELAAKISELGLASKPHSTRLAAKLRDHAGTIVANSRFMVAAAARPRLDAQYLELLTKRVPRVHARFFPESMLEVKRPYLVKLFDQVNVAYSYGLYDAASVLIRRIAEGLLIAAFERAGASHEIQRGGNYMYLRDMIGIVRSTKSFAYSRSFVDNIAAAKDLGDRAAHDRFHITSAEDVDSVAVKIRAAMSELLVLSGIAQ